MKSYNRFFRHPHSKMDIWGTFLSGHFECGRRKNAFLSRREVGSPGSFGTAVGTQPSPPCVDQSHWIPADGSTRKRLNGER